MSEQQMDQDHRELATRLFAVGSEIIERAHRSSIVGQAPDIDRKRAALCARNLAQAGQEIGVIASTLSLLFLQSHEGDGV